MTCKNCGNQFEGNFCCHCGQKATIRRIDYKYLAYEIPNSLFQLNRGLLFTIKELFIRPGHAIREFIEGKRKNYYKPIAFFLITSALYTFAAYMIGRNTFVGDIVLGVLEGMEAKNQTYGVEILNWVSRNQAYITLFIIPILALTNYLFFLKSGLNYYEHIVVSLYVAGQQMVIHFVLNFIFYKENLLILVPIMIGTIYHFWVYHQLFYQKKTIKKLLLIALSYFTFLFLITFIIFMIASIIQWLK